MLQEYCSIYITGVNGCNCGICGIRTQWSAPADLQGSGASRGSLGMQRRNRGSKRSEKKKEKTNPKTRDGARCAPQARRAAGGRRSSTHAAASSNPATLHIAGRSRHRAASVGRGVHSE